MLSPGLCEVLELASGSGFKHGMFVCCGFDSIFVTDENALIIVNAEELTGLHVLFVVVVGGLGRSRQIVVVFDDMAPVAIFRLEAQDAVLPLGNGLVEPLEPLEHLADSSEHLHIPLCAG